MTRVRADRRRRPAFAHLIPLVLILLLAAGLRFYALDAQSFWNDEGNTSRLVERPVALILKGAAGDVHPPGYYLVLHLWQWATGQSEFALRAYSALCGILTVAVTAAASRGLRHSHRRAGLAAPVAALLVAVNPLAVYYSQEARMYAQLGLASALTLWASVALVRGARRQWKWKAQLLRALGLAVCIAAGLYTQYTYILILAGLNFAFGAYWAVQFPWRSIRSGSRHGPILLTWMGAHALGGLLFLPWAPIAVGASGWRPPDLDSAAALGAMARTLIGGVTLAEPPGLLAFVVVGLLAGAALVVSLRAPRASTTRFGIWAALGMALAPPVIIAAAGVYRPAYLKFLISCIAPAAVALAAPLLAAPGSRTARTATPVRWRWSQVAGLLVIANLMPVQAGALRHLYTDPAFVRDDYRAIAALVAQHARPGDSILLDAPNQWEVFTYYYRGPLPVYPAPYRPDQQEAERWVTGTLAEHLGGRLFVLYWGHQESDPGQFIEGALAQQAYKAEDRWITSVRVATYGVASLPVVPDTVIDVKLGETVALEGYAVPGRTWQPGDIIPMTLFWTAEAPLSERYKVFVHLVDATGTLVGQADMEPVAGFRATTTWQQGEVIVDRYGLALPADLLAGPYTLRAGMYRFSGERLTVLEQGTPTGDFVTLGQISVAAPQ